jgi:DNA-binding transcriptional LysR family regulator
MAAKGLGIYICQVKIAQPYCEHMPLVVRPLTDAWAQVRVKIVYKPSLISPAAEALIDHLVHQHRSVSVRKNLQVPNQG